MSGGNSPLYRQQYSGSCSYRFFTKSGAEAPSSTANRDCSFAPNRISPRLGRAVSVSVVELMQSVAPRSVRQSPPPAAWPARKPKNASLWEEREPLWPRHFFPVPRPQLQMRQLPHPARLVSRAKQLALLNL